jgi:hypothetical protein
VQLLLLLVAASAGLASGFLLGRQEALSGLGMEPDDYLEMQAELPRAREQIAALEAELDVVSTRHTVDREALAMVRQDIALQKEHIASLEEGIRFYRGLMAPEDATEGLSLREPELVAREEGATIAFRILVLQEALKHDLLTGKLALEVFGERDGEPVSYPLAQLSDDIEGERVALRFRYFQAIEGQMTLPEGFTPDGISVEVTVNSPRKSEVRERFAWRLQERFSYVGE